MPTNADAGGVVLIGSRRDPFGVGRGESGLGPGQAAVGVGIETSTGRRLSLSEKEKDLVVWGTHGNVIGVPKISQRKASIRSTAGVGERGRLDDGLAAQSGESCISRS